MNEIVQTAVDQGPFGGTYYPFVDDSILIDCVLDAFLSYDDEAGSFSLPFLLTLSGTTVTITDDDGDSVGTFSMDTPTNSHAWGSERVVYEWVTATQTLRLVVRPAALVTGSGTLLTRAIYRLPRRVKSVRVGDELYDGKIRIAAGYNMKVEARAPVIRDGGLRETVISLDAIVGAGIGKYPGCEDLEVVLRRIAGQGPDDHGNFVIQADDCFKIQPQVSISNGVATRTEATLQISNDCRPCCDCDMYVNTYKGVLAVWDRWQAIATNSETARDTYTQNKDRWDEQKECRFNKPIRLLVLPENDCAAFVGGSFCNPTDRCLGEVVMTFTFNREFSINVATANGGGTDGEERYAPDVDTVNKTATFRFDYADPRTPSVAKMRVCLPQCTTGEPLTVTLAVTAVGLTPLPAEMSVNRTAALDATAPENDCAG